ncbi:hypothetical protein BD289DRAFT_366911 [Coniella lustricola]|uniref:Methyltransferase domain-containing protein n=1 Tax=Coniella lustricola TaxID=2025994 RepID=A0A2T3AAE7_9PEZI|nr:hypothetical protein BD289DRAFT_366911 [Coniella lustricola]
MPPSFEEQEYWHQRFENEACFEWLVPSATFMSILDPFLDDYLPSCRILHIGFGTSDLQNHLRARGFTNVLNIDYEPLAIFRGQQREKETFGNVQMKYAVADVTSNRHQSQQRFDIVVDKSTVDAVSCGGEEAFVKMLRSVSECLDGPGGIWISLSYSSQRFVLEKEEHMPFDVQEIARIPVPKSRATDPQVYYYCYLMRPRCSG